MSALQNRRIILGVCGGIAAYKSAEIIRRLFDAGAEVRVVMTASAQEFITPLTLQALSGNPVHLDLFDPEAEAAMGHIALARWADLILIAPATANTLAKLANGDSGDLLTTLCLASSALIAVAPAMNQQMWAATATKENIATLQARGVRVIGPASGEQACGDVGLGRMEEPPAIAEACRQLFKTGLLAGRKLVLTAGPTREAIDPVRYISNHSSGKMGYALAQAAVDAGAEVTLISGPVSLPRPERVAFVSVESARDMCEQCLLNSAEADIFIGAAAVADYRVENVAEKKIKKKASEFLQLSFVKNPDIIAEVAAQDNRPFVVGFAAETNDVVSYARKKMLSKKLDMIIANDVSDAAIGFNSDNNAVTILCGDSEDYLSVQNKMSLAREIISKIAGYVS